MGLKIPPSNGIIPLSPHVGLTGAPRGLTGDVGVFHIFPRVFHIVYSLYTFSGFVYSLYISRKDVIS